MSQSLFFEDRLPMPVSQTSVFAGILELRKSTSTSGQWDTSDVDQNFEFMKRDWMLELLDSVLERKFTTAIIEEQPG